MHPTPQIRAALAGDIPALSDLIEQSVRALNAREYDQTQVETALRHMIGVDTQMIADGTYYVAEIDGEIAGCGGWSRRKQLYGRGQGEMGTDAHQFLDPQTEPAKVRAFFVHPRWERRGIGRLLLQTCEQAAARAGFATLELMATLTGAPLYAACGFARIEACDVPLPGGVNFPAIKMVKSIGVLTGGIPIAPVRAA